MTPKEAIETLKIAIAEVEWNYPMDYAVAFESAIESLDKQIPKRPRVDDDSWYCCPRCDETFFMWDKLSRRLLYCGNCGQALDWGIVSE